MGFSVASIGKQLNGVIFPEPIRKGKRSLHDSFCKQTIHNISGWPRDHLVRAKKALLEIGHDFGGGAASMAAG